MRVGLAIHIRIRLFPNRQHGGKLSCAIQDWVVAVTEQHLLCINWKCTWNRCWQGTQGHDHIYHCCPIFTRCSWILHGSSKLFGLDEVHVSSVLGVQVRRSISPYSLFVSFLTKHILCSHSTQRYCEISLQLVRLYRCVSSREHFYSSITVPQSYTRSDTFHCRWGSTLAGVNSCFIEMHPSINNLKNRGINVATFGDDQSSQIGLEVTVLLVCYFCMQSFIVIVYLFRQRLERKHCDISSTSSSDNAGSKN